MSAADRLLPDMQGVAWTATSKEPRLDRPPPEADLDCDLAIVGGGYCGLGIALHAAAAGIDTRVFEAGVVGAG
ncbi:MAG: hypothetical protein KDC48_21685, partial [Planctomycetes bacterium]|nr:hypothetical protein [Planctomycetota bacterium]